MKRAVIYYSLEGNTQSAAAAIARALSAELYEIEPLKPLPTSGAKKFLIGGMQSSFGICPKLKDLAFIPSDYDQIILGTPVWAGKCASPMWSFLKKNHLEKKPVAVFTFSGSGKNEGCIRQLEKYLGHIEAAVSLADKKNAISSGNESRLLAFIEKLL